MRGLSIPLVAVLLLTGGLAGCIGGDPLDPTTTGTAPAGQDALPDDLSMEGAEVLDRSPEEVTFRWNTDAPVAAANVGPDGTGPTVETTFQLPADRFLSLSANATVLNDVDAGGWQLRLLDPQGDLRCQDHDGTFVSPNGVWLGGTLAACEIPLLQPLQDPEEWTLEVEFEQNPSPGAEVVAFLTLELVEPAVLHNVAEVRPLEVQAEGGTPLRGHVYLPTGEGPFPIILNYSPYFDIAVSGSSATGEQVQDRGDRTTLPGWMGLFLERGYAIALVSLRGTGTSGGCNAWFDPAVDGADAADVIEHLAARDWSDGTIGMVGISWHGYSQYAALLEQPEPLKAVAPASAILDPWTLWTRRGPTIISQFGPMATTYATFQALTGMGPGDQPRHVDCPSYAEHVQAFNQLTVDGDKTPYLEARSIAGILANNEVPMLVSNGLEKLGEGHILQIDGLWPLLNEQSRLLIGQWPHAYPEATPGENDYWPAVLAFMDHHVRGQGPAPTAGVVDYQDTAGAWHRDTVWPPEANTTRLYLSDGTLVTDQEDVRSSLQALQGTGTDPQTDDCPGDKALYLSPPVAEDVLLAGNIHTNLTVTSTQQNGNVGVFLWHLEELEPCGRTLPNVIDYEHEVSRALSDLRHRGHLEQGQPFPVGTPDLLSLQSHPFATPVKAGQRLVLAVTGGALELSAFAQKPELVVHTGPDVEAWIDLPVVQGELVFQERASGPTAPVPSLSAGVVG